MKKLISIVLALILVFSLATVAMAEGYTDKATVTMQLQYNATNSGTTSPAETITFTVTKGEIKENGAATWPADTDATDSVDDGGVTVDDLILRAGAADGTKYPVTIHLPAYTAVGIYTYNIRQNGTDKAGVTYFGGNITLVVTVIEQNGEVRVAAVHTETPVSPSYDANSTKSNTFVNTYSAGSLSVTKTVTGNLGDKDKYFAITVSLTDTTSDNYGTDYTGNTITVGQTSYSVTVDGKTTTNPTSITVGTPATFYLKDGETLTLGNIPYGTEYAVTEVDLNDYTETITGGDANGAGVVDSASETLVTVENHKEVEVDTGITLDSLPFVLILAVCAGAAVLFVIKRRNSVEF